MTRIAMDWHSRDALSEATTRIAKAEKRRETQRKSIELIRSDRQRHWSEQYCVGFKWDSTG